MKKYFALAFFFVFALPLFAQSEQTLARKKADALRVAPSAWAQFSALLNNPSMITPASAVPLGRNWFTLETDAHVFTNEVSVAQIRAALLDIENYEKNFDGNRSKLITSIVNRTGTELTVDFVSIAIVPFVNIRLHTPYRASVRSSADTNTKFGLDVTQLSQDSENNIHIKNLIAPRYAEEVKIGGKTYTYLRLYSKMDINAGIMPGAKELLESNSLPTNVESIQMIIAAAKTK